MTARPLVIAHRGASAESPENTLSAIRRAREQGADRIEIDVRPTRDGVLVVHHDDDLARTAGDPRRVDALTLAELQQIRLRGLGEPVESIPTLRSALLAAAPIPLLVEVKVPEGGARIDPRALAAAVAAELAACDAPAATAVISFHDAVVDALVPTFGRVRVGSIRGSDTGAESWRDLLAGPTDLVVVSQKIASPATVSLLVNAGKTVFVYALDDADSVRRFAAAGAAGIITNRPALALAALRASP